MPKVNEDGTLTLNKLEIIMLAGALAVVRGVTQEEKASIDIGRLTFDSARKSMGAEGFDTFRRCVADGCDAEAIAMGFSSILDTHKKIVADQLKGLDIAEIDLSALKKKYGN